MGRTRQKTAQTQRRRLPYGAKTLRQDIIRDAEGIDDSLEDITQGIAAMLAALERVETANRNNNRQGISLGVSAVASQLRDLRTDLVTLRLSALRIAKDMSDAKLETEDASEEEEVMTDDHTA